MKTLRLCRLIGQNEYPFKPNRPEKHTLKGGANPCSHLREVTCTNAKLISQIKVILSYASLKQISRSANFDKVPVFNADQHLENFAKFSSFRKI